MRSALAPFDRGGGGEGPYHVQHDLQTMMQDLVGIVRREEEMQRSARRTRSALRNARPPSA